MSGPGDYEDPVDDTSDDEDEDDMYSESNNPEVFIDEYEDEE